MNDVSIPVWEKDEKGSYYVSLHGIRWYPNLCGCGLSAVYNWKSPEDILKAAADRAVVAVFIRTHTCPAADTTAAA